MQPEAEKIYIYTSFPGYFLYSTYQGADRDEN